MSRKLGPTANYPGGITVENEHRLLNPNDEFYYSAAKAGKTGYLQAAGNTLVTYAEQDGRRLVSVILRGTAQTVFYRFQKSAGIRLPQFSERVSRGDGEPVCHRR